MGRCLSPRPADLELGWRFPRAHDLHGAVLRPVAAAGMDLSERSLPLATDEPQLRPDPLWVARRPFEPDAQARLGPQVVIQLGLRSILGHHQIHPPVLIVVRQGRYALFAVNL